MSLLYSKKTRKVIKWIWGVFAVIIALSMIFAYMPGLF